MSELFVKICGITRLQDAELAVELGASAVGFVFWPNSPRYVPPDMVRAMTAGLPPHVMKVGVFVDESVDAIRKIVETAALSAVQLHGSETPDDCRQLSGSTVIKAIAITENGTAHIDRFDPEVVLLADAHDAERYGGTGKTVNWDAVREIAATRRTILAGGLNANNIQLAVRSVRPYGVDISSGVESTPGVKDPSRLRSFFEALHE